MRNAGLALALVATAQLTVLSSPAFAQDDNSKAAAQAPSETTTESAPTTSSQGQDAKQKEKTGWIVLAAGGVGFVTGVVFDVIGGFSGHIAGAGGPGDDGNTSVARPAWVFAGTTLIVAGLAAGIYGGSMILSARKGGDQTNSPRPADDSASGGDSVTKAAAAKAASAPSIVVPILGATF